MDPDGSQYMSMDPYWSKWIQMDPYEKKNILQLLHITS